MSEQLNAQGLARPKVPPKIDKPWEIHGLASVDAYVHGIHGYAGANATLAKTGATYALRASGGARANALVQRSWVSGSTDQGSVLLEAS